MNRGCGERKIKLNKHEMVDELYKLGYTKSSSKVVINDIFRIIAEALISGDKVKVFGFGNFEAKITKGHKYKDINTGEMVNVDECVSVKFKPSKNLRIAIKNKDASQLRELLSLVEEDGEEDNDEC